MEIVMAIAALAGVAGLWAVAQPKQERRAIRMPLPVDPRIAQANRTRLLRDQQSRTFQTALLQLASAPDFRRAAASASAATLVPVEFRRRQFNRFRANIITHYQQCLTAGTNDAIILQSLRTLVQALGIAAFEAEYVRDVAHRANYQPQPVLTHAQRMAALKRDHDTRVAAIREGLRQTPEIQEQLLEAEENRFRQELESAFDTSTGT